MYHIIWEKRYTSAWHHPWMFPWRCSRHPTWHEPRAGLPRAIKQVSSYIQCTRKKLSWSYLGSSHVSLSGLLVVLVERELGVVVGLLGGSVSDEPDSLAEAFVQRHVCWLLFGSVWNDRGIIAQEIFYLKIYAFYANLWFKLRDFRLSWLVVKGSVTPSCWEK